MNKWKEVKLGDVCEIVKRGITPKYVNDNGIKVINQKCIRNYQINFNLCRFTDKNKKYTSEKFLKNLDILINSTGIGTVGRVAQLKTIKEKLLCDSHVMIVRANNLIKAKFLGYILKSRQKEIEKLAEGSTGQVELSPKRLIEMSILTPPLPIQKKIADILSVIDEKIETLQNINSTLEEMAKAIFKSWFVDFDIVKAKEKGKSDSEIAKELGINEDIVKLFPSEFEESEIGKIPKGWEVRKLGDYIELLNGYAFKSKYFTKNGKYGIVTIKNVKQSYFENKCENYINELSNNIKEHQILHTGDILLSLTGNVGRVCIVIGDNYLLNQRVAKLRSKIKNFSSLGYYLFLQDKLFNKLQNIAKGTAQKNLSPLETANIRITLPNNINIFTEIFENIFNQSKNNLLQIQTLQELRDTLLPKLIKGEIEVDKLDIKGFE